MILIYTSFGSASTKKVKQWLKKHKLCFVERNIHSIQLEKDEIRYLLERSPNGSEDIISKKSQAYKDLAGNIDDFTTSQLVDIIQQSPTILKRPIIIDKQNFIVGYDVDEITTFTPRHKREGTIAVH